MMTEDAMATEDNSAETNPALVITANQREQVLDVIFEFGLSREDAATSRSYYGETNSPNLDQTTDMILRLLGITVG